MGISSDAQDVLFAYPCPVCGGSLPYHPVFHPFEVPCTECGAYIWCWKRVRDGVIVLEALPNRTPSPLDLERVIESLLDSSDFGTVVINLSELDAVSSAFMARLVTMNKRIRGAGGRFILCELKPIVREVLHRFRLDSVFDIVSREDDAVEAFKRPAAAIVS